jgi:hypothetical protein
MLETELENKEWQAVLPSLLLHKSITRHAGITVDTK